MQSSMLTPQSSGKALSSVTKNWNVVWVWPGLTIQERFLCNLQSGIFHPVVKYFYKCIAIQWNRFRVLNLANFQVLLVSGLLHVSYAHVDPFPGGKGRCTAETLHFTAFYEGRKMREMYIYIYKQVFRISFWKFLQCLAIFSMNHI